MAKFPSNFIFGVADADLQVIGEKHTISEEQSLPTTWRNFALTSGKCFNNTTPDDGCDRYHRWPEDLELMKKLGVSSYRTSASMCRILKQNGEPNSKALAWYRNYFKAIRQAGMGLYLTLYHWELPQFLEEQGGWKNPNTINWLVKHAKVVATELGEYVNEYFILNEPWCSSVLSYHWGVNPPGETNLQSALIAAHNLLLAQGVIMRELKQIAPQAKISTVLNHETAYAASLEPQDISASQYADGYFNLWYLDPIFKGHYPEKMCEFYGKNLPTFPRTDMETIKIGSELHALGVNFYAGCLAKADPQSEKGYESILRDGGTTNDVGWGVWIPPHYPPALYDLLQQLYFGYRDYGLARLYITENGMALANEPAPCPDDSRRIEYMKGHLKQVHMALERGVPVEAYFAWTLMDNYEWTQGYQPRACFGLVQVERPSLERHPKKSYYWYQQLCQSRIL